MELLVEILEAHEHTLRRVLARITGFLMVISLAAAVDVGVRHGRNMHAVSPVVLPPTQQSAGPPTTSTLELVPQFGPTLVHGTLTSFHANNAVAAPLQPPFIITVAQRGAGGATFLGVNAGGRQVAIDWYGGQPLPVTGTGNLDLAGAPVTIDASGITWMLDGPARSIGRGHYVLGAPVAAGTKGLARAYDSYAFDAGDNAILQTSGTAMIRQAPHRVHLEGPGQLTLIGNFQMTTTSGKRRAVSISFGGGSYRIDLTPVPQGYLIDALLQGVVTVK
jgi:hypothetical protein